MSPQSAGERDETWPNLRYSWYVVGVLLLTYTLSFADRQILSLLVTPIKADLHLSDTQVSLLQGFAFAVFYGLMGLPVGRLADRSVRRNIIVVGVVLWSVMTACCGLAKNFPQLFLARMGVGVGEASLSPSTYSMLGDYFRPHQLGRALSIYSLGITLGQGCALMLGGAIVAAVGAIDSTALPLVGGFAPWRIAFLALAVPGILVVLLLLTVREPTRRGQGTAAGEASGAKIVPLSEATRFFRDNKRVYVPLFLALASLTAMTQIAANWLPTLFVRIHGLDSGEIGLYFGLIMLIAGSGGIYFGGWLADFLTARGRQDATLRVLMLAPLLICPFGVLAPLMPTVGGAWIMTGFLTFANHLPWGVAPTAIQIITPNRMRGQFSALYLLALYLIGSPVGATTVAVLTDYVFQRESAINYSFALAHLLLAPIALLLLRYCLNRFQVTVQRAYASAK